MILLAEAILVSAVYRIGWVHAICVDQQMWPNHTILVQ